ncbi:MAG: bifunctional demethylmenaquinone methyltransferase/2-methoxy-6-polyprenyl-1,4-benzoquinol methylase UbiE [Rhodospirillales bacterium]|nr:bifunctional demethylmenaquinone methyltransferase/2-methoxy-6-polyprenyl-1,4-benzoquinol methylase UbiE [Rhodospirillales bacterium]MCW8861720.1 bifunctional demethylmenaquinone methyltransferase/2-methoxy-6-polyprenyl-1,4-benzoquinol methylase UbiE [Rhodospirillales bacterium]MCW8951094.1 bifunctional demethylmenaquinone methyltransferase/2-methoxy-6-polyprenyl-1,4-benzoquinol methylase UbiE [Rhodospirillales bacterium]MCW9003240.1 bifunctional demethylmenaquinone methyltransferase/2-methox
MRTNTANESQLDSTTTHFGFETVPEAEKAGLVRDVFDSVASRYDLMNDLMSGGIHRLWKGSMIDWLAPRPGMRFLDVGGGTGDIAFRIREKIMAAGGVYGATDGEPDISVCDINREMLQVGRNRAIDRGILSGLSWVCGDAEALPFPDSSMDAYTIAFCIRNVTHIDRALAEARRVLRPGGRFLCLEFSRVIMPGLDRLYDTYSFRILPWLGEMVADDRDSYRYLAESIRRFPDQETFAAMIEDAGMEQVSVRNLSGGIAALHSGWRV